MKKKFIAIIALAGALSASPGVAQGMTREHARDRANLLVTNESVALSIFKFRADREDLVSAGGEATFCRKARRGWLCNAVLLGQSTAGEPVTFALKVRVTRGKVEALR